MVEGPDMTCICVYTPAVVEPVPQEGRAVAVVVVGIGESAWES